MSTWRPTCACSAPRPDSKWCTSPTTCATKRWKCCSTTTTLRNPDTPDYPYRRELEWLRDFAAVLEAGRGKADTVDRLDYNFKLDGERISIVPRKRGSPIDKVVSELMIFANAHWGGWLAENRVPGIYRAQANGKTRMTTAPDPHVGLGVDQYAWSSSPLRRYVDLVNQRQLISLVQQTDPVYPPRSEQLFSVVREFELAYDAYNEFQRKLERYWMLRWLHSGAGQRSHRQRDPRGPGALRHAAAGDARAVGDGRRGGRQSAAGDLQHRPARHQLSRRTAGNPDASRLTARQSFRRIRASPTFAIRMVTAAPPPLAEPSKQGTRMALALLASAAVHGMVLSTQFVQVNPRLFEDPNLPMEVVLVNAKSAESPLNPDALAQVNLAGGGNTDEDRRLKSPLARQRTDPNRQRRSRPAGTRVAKLEQQAKTLLSQLKPDAQLAESAAGCAADARPARHRRQPDQPAGARNGAAAGAHLAAMGRPTRSAPNARSSAPTSSEYAFARYVEDWVTKVERVGNVNYPEAARRQGIYGSLKLTVSIYADGRLEAVEVDRSSGSKILDAAAVKIVELATPYAAFPEDMRKKTDILSITRTWTFTRSDQLVGTD